MCFFFFFYFVARSKVHMYCVVLCGVLFSALGVVLFVVGVGGGGGVLGGWWGGGGGGVLGVWS